MKRWRCLLRDDRGFIPVLLALLIAFGGMISLGAFVLSRSAASLQSGKANLEQLAELEKTIRAYVYLNRRLPCPANGDDMTGAAKTTCTGGNNDGVVPWGELGLPKEAIRDPYGRMISYSVDPLLTSGNVCTGSSPVNTALPGSIRINPSAATSLFVLISHGPNGYGGWLPGGRQSANPASSPERENCADSAANNSTVTCADPDPRAVTQGPIQGNPDAPEFFDDTVAAARSEDYTALCNAIDTVAADEDEDGRRRHGRHRDHDRNRNRHHDRDNDNNRNRNGRDND